MLYEQAVAEFRKLDGTVEDARWRQAQIVWELTEQGYTQVQLAKDLGRSVQHINTLVRAWRLWGITSGGNPSVTYEDAYRMAKSNTSTPEEAIIKQDVMRARSAAKDLPPAVKAQLVEDWIASDEGGRTQAEISLVIHKRRVAAESHLANVREARVREGKRPDFEGTEAVMRVVNDYVQLLADSAKLPQTISERGRRALSNVASRALATVEYHSQMEQERPLTDEELESFIGGAQ